MDTITRDLQSAPPWMMLYADDIMLAPADRGDLEHQIEARKDRLARIGLRLNLKKTEYSTVNVIEPTTITVSGAELLRTEASEYLGLTIGSDGSLAHEITCSHKCSLGKIALDDGVLCDRYMPDRLKSQIYRTVVRPVALYGAECWPATEEVERRMG